MNKVAHQCLFAICMALDIYKVSFNVNSSIIRHVNNTEGTQI